MIGTGRVLFGCGFVGMYLTPAVYVCFLTSQQFIGWVGMPIKHYIKTLESLWCNKQNTLLTWMHLFSMNDVWNIAFPVYTFLCSHIVSQNYIKHTVPEALVIVQYCSRHFATYFKKDVSVDDGNFLKIMGLWEYTVLTPILRTFCEFYWQLKENVSVPLKGKGSLVTLLSARTTTSIAAASVLRRAF